MLKNLHRTFEDDLFSSIPVDYNRYQSLGQHFDDGPLVGCNSGGLGVVLDTFCVFDFPLAFYNKIFTEAILESRSLLEASTYQLK